jgi:hypothetical protein
MWSRTAVQSFLAEHPIDTGGSVSQHHITVTEEDDGDVFFCVRVPIFVGNRVVTSSVLKLGLAACGLPDTLVLVRTNGLIIDFFKSVCDGE